MNCKPGDLAAVVSTMGVPENIKLLGRILRVVEMSEFQGYWTVDAVGWPTRFCADAALRPLRDHGDEAKDEMLRPLPSEVEHA